MNKKRRLLEGDKLENSLERIARFVNDNKNFITKVYRIRNYNDEPKLFAYSASYKTKDNDPEAVASGVSLFNKNRALIRLLGETLERHCLDNFYEQEQKFITARISKLTKPLLAPLKIVSFSKKQLQSKSFQKFIIREDSKFKWIVGFSLFHKTKVLIPAQLVFTSYQNISGEPWIRMPISTGAASDTSLERAIYTGICEVVERDAFMISYLNKLSSPTVNLASLEDETINQIIPVFNRYRLELIVREITTDIKIPVFMAITLDKTGHGPAVSIGLKAGFNIKETIIGAIEESLMVRSWQRDRFIYGATIQKKPRIIRTIEDRAYYWFKRKSIDYLDFWLESKNTNRLNLNTKLSDKNKEFIMAVSLLEKANVEVYYVDITHSKMKKLGFRVVKVIIPQLQPLYLDEKYPYFGGSRLYDVPVKLGLLNSPNQEKQLNKIPHPFL